MTILHANFMEKFLADLLKTVRGEILKLRHTSLPWICAGVMILISLVLNGFLYILSHPGMGAQMGLLGQKASLAFGPGPLDGSLLGKLLLEMSGLGSLILHSFLLTWLFGREYQSGTMKNLLVLPLPRRYFALAKGILGMAGTVLLLSLLWTCTLLLAALQDLPGLEGAWTGEMLTGALVTVLTGASAALPVSWVTVKTRGMFAPLGFAVGTLLAASLFGSLGWGPYIPWSAVLILSGAGGAGLTLDAFSWIILGLTALGGLGLTMVHLEKADHSL